MQLPGAWAALVVVFLPVQPAAAFRVFQAQQSTSFNSSSPVPRIVELLQGLKQHIEDEGDAEQQSYEKFARWCEDTLGQKAAEITATKDEIDGLQTGVLELRGQKAVHSSQISHLQNEIQANAAAQSEARELRQQEKTDYIEEKNQNEQAIGALEAAIHALSSPSKKGFLETLQEARLYSVIAGVRGVLAKPAASNVVGHKDLEVVQRFVDHPQDFFGGDGDREGVLSAAQIPSSPYGDYIPRSGQVAGILKTMYDSFVHDLEKANADEADRQRAYDELMSTKATELSTMKRSLQSHKNDEATKNQNLVNDKNSIDDTQAQLAATKALFSDTKAMCELKAHEIAQRTRLRTLELQGVDKAIDLLSDPENMKIFHASANSFLQIAQGEGSQAREKAYQHLRKLATRFGNLQIARLAVSVRSGSREKGHFDEVITQIDNMIAFLRKEEMEDVKHRDFCQRKEKQNSNNIEDKQSFITKAGQQVQRLNTKEAALRQKIQELTASIERTNSSMTETSDMRAQDRAAFVQAMKDDEAAIALLEKAKVILRGFFKDSDTPLGLLEDASASVGGNATGNATGPTSPPPKLSWDNGMYAGRKEETGGIVAILHLVQEDMKSEMERLRSMEAEARDDYVKDMNALQETMDTYAKAKASKEMEAAELNAKIADVEAAEGIAQDDLTVLEELKQGINVDCNWVTLTFTTRQTKRKAELAGLNDAKNFLAGVDNGI